MSTPTHNLYGGKRHAGGCRACLEEEGGSMNDEPTRYTLTEAREELARQLCDYMGHQLRMGGVSGRGFAPQVIYCERCYTEWDVVPCRHGRGLGDHP